jgi:lysine-ketoglutarate reductase/saccharopine dehydrogenase-like protein (TIGR00300 family)
MKRRFTARGHLIDSGIMTAIFNLIIEENASYEMVSFQIGTTNQDYSLMEIDVFCDEEVQMDQLTRKLVRLGCYETKTPQAIFKPAEKSRCVPGDFYSTTNHRTEVFLDGSWREVQNQRMDAMIIQTPGGPICKKLRDIELGDMVLCGADSVRVFPPFRDRESDDFGFMTGDVSSERSVEIPVSRIAEDFKRIRNEGGKIIAVAGPVVVHTGGREAFAALIRHGYIQGVLSGNALAVHDIESVLYGTSLGIDVTSGRPSREGHKNHMRAINKINLCGSIEQAVSEGVLDRGIMYELVKYKVPYCLAGSIRDDGPLPETENDMIRAQTGYSEILEEVSYVLMLSTMLHSIGTGNMLPSWVRTVCVDINPAVVTKLTDRGSSQTIGIVCDVGLFLRALAHNLIGSL